MLMDKVFPVKHICYFIDDEYTSMLNWQELYLF